jgi:hypothetical protein
LKKARVGKIKGKSKTVFELRQSKEDYLKKKKINEYNVKFYDRKEHD